MALISAQEVYNILYDAEIRTSAIFKTLASGYYDPTTGARTDGTETEVTVYISPPMSKKQYANGDLVSLGDQIIYFSPYDLSFTPVLGQRVEINAEDWTIVHYTEIESGGGTIAAYEVGIKK